MTTWMNHEAVTVCLEKIDQDASRRLNLGTVFTNGGQDTYMGEARRRAVTFFRPLAGNANYTSGKDVNKVATDCKGGKYDARATRLCGEFNKGVPCDKIDSKGVCTRLHKCNQFVADKGPGGMCKGDHPRCLPCDYDASLKLDKPLK